jgi:uncharacterized protein (DUF885 family)
MTDPVANADAATTLSGLADEMWEGGLAAEPLLATMIGDRRYLTQLAANDAPAEDREIDRLKGLQGRVQALDPEGLGEADRVTRLAMLDQLAHELGLAESRTRGWAVDPLDGPQVDLLNVESYQPIDSSADGQAAIERWRAMGPWIDRHVEGLRRGLADGHVAPRSLVDKVVEELDDLLDQPVEAWPLSAPAAVDRPDWPAGRQEAFGEKLVDAVRDSIRPAFVRHRAFLADELRGAARSNDEPGLCHVPGGESAYAHLTRAHTTLDLTPAEIHAIGLAETERIDAEFEALGARVLGAAGRSDTLRRLRSDPDLYFGTSDEVRETAEGALRRATEATPSWFGRLPRTPCEVVVMGDHES